MDCTALVGVLFQRSRVYQLEKNITDRQFLDAIVSSEVNEIKEDYHIQVGTQACSTFKF